MVVASKRGTNKFQVLIEAQKLCKYTLEICTNENVFIPRYKTALTDDLIRISKDIFINLLNANRKDLVKEHKLRKAKMDKAIDLCDDLLSLIQIAKPIFHLSNKRIKYWGSLIFNVQNLTRSWKESDLVRYKKKLKETS